MTWEDAYARLDAIEGMYDDCDEQDCKSPSDDSISAARECVAFLMAIGAQPPKYVIAGEDCDCSIGWGGGNWIEFDEDGVPMLHAVKKT